MSASILPGCGIGDGLVPGYARFRQYGDYRPKLELNGRFQGRDFTLDSPFRVASISKMLVAELARRLDGDDAVDMDMDAGEAIGFSLRHPQFPEEPVTLRRLISHQSGIIDPPIYWMAGGGDIRTLLTPDIWEADVRPGASFRYSNLNYGIAATVMEAVTGERFDHLFTRRVAEPLGLDIGFNWSGVSQEKRRQGFPCLRGQPGAWEIQVDGADTLADSHPAILRQPGWQLDDYIPGTNGTLFSPQGGLRASVADLIEIARKILLPQPELRDPVWQAISRGAPGSESEVIEGRPSESGHFVAFGEGHYIYPEGPLGYDIMNDVALIGHHGEAYGFYGGVWAGGYEENDQFTPFVFVHANLGSPEGGFPMTGNYPNHTTVAEQAFVWSIRWQY